MALFFFVVGLEIKREVLVGEMRVPRHAALAIAAAAGGVVVPALVFLALTPEGPARQGWGVPIGTDTAFALGIITLFGSRVRPVLLVFLTAFSIVDDILAVGVIAIFYTDAISIGALAAALALLAALVVANLAGWHRWPIYAVLGGAVWVAVLKSGVHATAAGVLVALVVPARSWINPSEFLVRGRRLLDDFEAACYVAPSILTNEPQQQATHALGRLVQQVETPMTYFQSRLTPLVAFGILPVFAFANAGVPLTSGLADAVREPGRLGRGGGPDPRQADRHRALLVRSPSRLGIAQPAAGHQLAPHRRRRLPRRRRLHHLPLHHRAGVRRGRARPRRARRDLRRLAGCRHGRLLRPESDAAAAARGEPISTRQSRRRAGAALARLNQDSREATVTPRTSEHAQRAQRVPAAGPAVAVLEREVDRARVRVLEQPRAVGLLLRRTSVDRLGQPRVRAHRRPTGSSRGRAARRSASASGTRTAASAGSTTSPVLLRRNRLPLEQVLLAAAAGGDGRRRAAGRALVREQPFEHADRRVERRAHRAVLGLAVPAAVLELLAEQPVDDARRRPDRSRRRARPSSR